MNEKAPDIWDGIANNPTLGRLGETSPEETLSQEEEAPELGFDGSPSHRELNESPGIRAAGHGTHKPIKERLNDSQCFAFAVASPGAGAEIVSSGSIPPGVYEVTLFLRTTAAAVNRVNANLMQQDLPVGSVLTDSAQVAPFTFPRVTVQPGQAIRVTSILAEGAVTYFGELILTLLESYGRG